MARVILLSFGILAHVIGSNLGFYLHHPSLSRNCSCHSLLPLGFSLVFFMIFGLEGCISRWLWGSPLLLWSFLHQNSYLKWRFRLQLLRYEVHPSNEGLWHFFYLVWFRCFIFSYIHLDMKKPLIFHCKRIRNFKHARRSNPLGFGWLMFAFQFDNPRSIASLDIT